MNDEHTLVQAAFDGDVANVRRLLDAGVPVEAANDNWNALHAAIENQQFDCVRLLVERGADIDSDNRGMTPLAHAVDIAVDGTIQTGGSPGDEPTEIIQLLLDHGASPVSGLEVARAYGSNKIISLLESATRAS